MAFPRFYFSFLEDRKSKWKQAWSFRFSPKHTGRALSSLTAYDHMFSHGTTSQEEPCDKTP